MNRELRWTWRDELDAFLYRLWYWRDIRRYKRNWRERPLGMSIDRLRRSRIKLAYYRELEMPEPLIRYQIALVERWEREVARLRSEGVGA